jgi:hypothetical protein
MLNNSIGESTNYYSFPFFYLPLLVQNPVAIQWGIISSVFSSIIRLSSFPLSPSLLPLMKWIKLQFYSLDGTLSVKICENYCGLRTT